MVALAAEVGAGEEEDPPDEDEAAVAGMAAAATLLLPSKMARIRTAFSALPSAGAR